MSSGIQFGNQFPGLYIFCLFFVLVCLWCQEIGLSHRHDCISEETQGRSKFIEFHNFYAFFKLHDKDAASSTVELNQTA